VVVMSHHSSVLHCFSFLASFGFSLVLLLTGGVIPEPWAGASAQQNSTKLVRVNVSVTDADGKPVTDLTQADFAILEDGREQKITRFIKATAPLRVMIVVDASGSMAAASRRIQEALTEFVSSLGPYDEVAVISFSESPSLDTDFSVDVDRVRRAIRGIQFERDQNETTALYDSMHVVMKRIQKQEPTVRTALVLITDGEDTASREVRRKESVQSINPSFVSFYPFRVRIESGPRGPLSFPRGRGVNEYLKDLALLTGGEYFEADEMIERNLESVARHLSHHYLLGYDSLMCADKKKDNHTIEVRVSRPNTKIKATQTVWHHSHQ
jgi:Ca-activated chloride channel family protein